MRIILTILLWVTLFSGMYAQNIVVGVVTDSNNEPIANIKISCMDSQQAVLSNLNGEYSIVLEENCNNLVYDGIGISLSERIDGRTVINMKMTECKSLNEKKFYRFNVMLNAGGSLVYGAISGSILITDYISLDAGLGLGKIYGGTTFYINSPFKNKKWQPYIGANIAYFEEFMGPVSTLIYIPSGLRFLSYTGTSISVELAFLASSNDLFRIKTPIWGGFRFGKYF